MAYAGIVVSYHIPGFPATVFLYSFQVLFLVVFTKYLSPAYIPRRNNYSIPCGRFGDVLRA